MNYSTKQNRTERTGMVPVSSTECIAWLAVFMTEAVAIVTLNIITIIVFMRNRSLRKRSMYLVIHLVVADVLVGGLSVVTNSVLFLGDLCSFWQYHVTPSEFWKRVIYSMNVLFLMTSPANLAAISLERMHATFFSVQASRHRQMDLWSNYCSHLGFSCAGNNCF